MYKVGEELLKTLGSLQFLDFLQANFDEARDGQWNLRISYLLILLHESWTWISSGHCIIHYYLPQLILHFKSNFD
jgi:hypothetical protein